MTNSTKKRGTSKLVHHGKLKIFISHSHRDKEAVDLIAENLASAGHSIWIDRQQLQPGDSISSKIQEGLERADAIIFVISSNALRSEWVQREFVTVVLQQISKQQQRIIPIRLDECEVPSYLADRLYIDFASDFSGGLRTLLTALKVPNPEALELSTQPTIADIQEMCISKLRDHLRQGRLTLFCGAGVSVGAGIPVWDKLLAELLDSLMKRMSQDHSLDLGNNAAIEFLGRNSASSLILGKYLKNDSGRKFAKDVRDVLYKSNPTTCALIQSIVTLARPQRYGQPLNSIVTFNFDCLIEENLGESNIANKAIFSEAINHGPNEMPIYHVHGYLPRDGDIADETELVFSEDAYHSQFIDPFSWSNLIQLNCLTQNTCLFVGISLTDPNMRRLLDVAWRKNPGKSVRHYIAKKLPKSSDGKDELDKVFKILEEQDANALGLNVVWVNDHDELPGILEKIAALTS
jgi:TIR domain/SIR2-like domain